MNRPTALNIISSCLWRDEKAKQAARARGLPNSHIFFQCYGLKREKSASFPQHHFFLVICNIPKSYGQAAPALTICLMRVVGDLGEVDVVLVALRLMFREALRLVARLLHQKSCGHSFHNGHREGRRTKCFHYGAPQSGATKESVKNTTLLHCISSVSCFFCCCSCHVAILKVFVTIFEDRTKEHTSRFATKVRFLSHLKLSACEDENL